MLSQLTVTFAFFALILVAVYWVNRAISLFDRLISDGQTAWVFLQFTALTLPNVILLVLPVAAFVATLYVTNRVISESEFVVMQSAGMSPYRLVRPALVFGLGVTLVMSILAHVLVPLSRVEIGRMQARVAQDVTAQLLTEGQFLHPADGVTLYIREITERGELRDILLADQSSEKVDVLYLADRALVVRAEEGPQLVMFDGMSQTLRLPDQRLSTVAFKDFSYDLSGFLEEGGIGRPDLRFLPTSELLAASPASRAATGKSRAAFLTEAHSRIAQPFLGLSLAVIGASALLLGGFSRFGVTRQILVAVFAVIALQLLNNLAVDAATTDETMWPTLYMPPIVGLLFALGVLWLAARPALFVRRSADAAPAPEAAP
ncbi:LPS export ABC transporter permease LptF [Brevirhabdus pacifica]|uniref:LPS export ABC transporter permease LptF n=2 Tax=Brevirhabdus pacifica TaxID=1267768 RepID=A0A1U7DLG1_9RHOB|nr:LPS export ABC transporter permease LptF [Brevirhabdus pacifica]APX90755.1 LPS export ABC transporter permease LptF [Brevirhabdus pacifica]OWU79543.1 permease [Loktanella sp. 22II-4b]